VSLIVLLESFGGIVLEKSLQSPQRKREERKKTTTKNSVLCPP
jgi:hypothetical protein